MKNSTKAKTKNSDSTKEKKRRIIGLVVAILVLLGILFLAFKGCSDNPADPSARGLVYDSEAVTGGWDEADIDKIKEGLNEKVQAGMINISMNTAPKFENGSAEGNLMIVNETINNYPQIVIITRNDTGEVVYESDGIAVGSKIEKAKLDVVLPAGTYECTAMFHNVDPETGASLGCAGAEIEITVLN
ncbi:MAG: hypothetical protein IJZ07_06700 [Clostridia bacterium]|nr:hypothetical protein [Clostridia bacterium]